MIRDVDELDAGTELRTDVAVVGAGFAGIELARRLGAAGVQVLLLEGGRRDFDPRTQELTRERSVGKPLRTPSPDSPFTPYLPARFRGESRLRQFGGTSNIWTGKWRAFDPLDLGARPWIPWSGWPIPYEELASYYTEVARTYGLADAGEPESRPEVAAAREHLARSGLTLSFHYWQATPARPARTHADELAASPTIEVLLGANVTELVLADDRATVDHLEVRSLAGKRVRVRAARVALTAGGFETTRLLLASDRHLPGGIGDGHGLLGRFHMDHPKTKRGRLHPGPALGLIEPWTRTDPRPRFHASLELDDDLQREQQVLDHALYLSPVFRHLVDYPDREVAAIRDAVRRRRPTAAIRAAVGLVRTPRAAAKVLARTFLGERRGRVAHYVASMYVEQAPNPESRLSLSDETDELGMRRLVVDWRVSDLDERSFATTIEVLADRLQQADVGRLELDPAARSLDGWVDAAHHMGSTRMADRPERGVVDPDGRVFGTTNLYVASSSVFPTGHSAAPTMTIIALALRLADHLLAQRAPHERPEPACLPT